MNNTMFNMEACTKCGLCAEVCPVGIISLMAGKRPALPYEMQQRCVACGHCEAICPSNAITVTGPELRPPVSEALPHDITAGSIAAYFRTRRSVRCYEQKAVDKKLLDVLFDVVRFAPTGVNRQPVRWIVLHDTAELRRVTGLVADWMRRMIRENNPMAAMMNFPGLVAGWDNGTDPICRNAPHLAVAYAHKDDRIAATDATIALTHLELAAPAFGLGACWAGYFGIAAGREPEIARAVGVPGDNVPLGAMMLGHPKHRYRRIPKRKKLDITWK